MPSLLPLLLSLAAGGLAVVLLLRTSRRKPLVRTISSIAVYPVKSFRGIQLDSSLLFKHGLAHDRLFALAARDKEGNYEVYTSYADAKVSRFSVAFSDASGSKISLSEGSPTHLSISVLDSERTLLLPLQPSTFNLALVPFAVFSSSPTDAYDLGDEYASFFAPTFPGKDIRLLFKGPSPRRLTGNGTHHSTHTLLFPNVLPLLLTSTSSLASLQSEIAITSQTTFSMERFRPNLVFSDGVPWEEDAYQLLRLVKDGSELEVVGRCMRCSVPQIDPETGVKDVSEPTRTMSRFRRIDKGAEKKSCFGMLAVPIKLREGDESTRVSVGDKVEVLKTGGHFYIKGY